MFLHSFFFFFFLTTFCVANLYICIWKPLWIASNFFFFFKIKAIIFVKATRAQRVPSLTYLPVCSLWSQHALGSWLRSSEFPEFFFRQGRPCLLPRSKPWLCYKKVLALGLLVNIHTSASSSSSIYTVRPILSWISYHCLLHWALLSWVSSLAAWRVGVKLEGPLCSGSRIFIYLFVITNVLMKGRLAWLCDSRCLDFLDSVMVYTWFSMDLTGQHVWLYFSMNINSLLMCICPINCEWCGYFKMW